MNNHTQVECTMNPLRSCLVTVLTLAALGCHGDAVTNSPLIPSAATTWMNAVSDTGQLDIRVVDIPSNAGFFDANFRDALQFPQAIEAGRRHVRVFLSSTDPAITQQTLVDTTYDFVVDQRYGFYVTGFARSEERRVGKECRSWLAAVHRKDKAYEQRVRSRGAQE